MVKAVNTLVKNTASISNSIFNSLTSKKAVSIICLFIVLGVAVILITHIQKKTLEKFNATFHPIYRNYKDGQPLNMSKTSDIPSYDLPYDKAMAHLKEYHIENCKKDKKGRLNCTYGVSLPDKPHTHVYGDNVDTGKQMHRHIVTDVPSSRRHLRKKHKLNLDYAHHNKFDITNDEKVKYRLTGYHQHKEKAKSSFS